MRVASSNKTHVIRWKSTTTGGSGIGTKLFDQQEAERLAAELNEEFPDIKHEATIPPPPVAEPTDARPDPAIVSER